MEVTRRLRTDQAGKDGLACIHLTFCWAGQRLRLGCGQKCASKDWDARRQRVRPRVDSYAEAINQVLDDYTDVAEAAEQHYQYRGQALSQAQLREEIAQRLAALADERAGRVPLPAPPAPAPPTFSELYSRWLGEQARAVNLRTGQRLSKSYLDSLANSLGVFEEFAAATRQPLALAHMSHAFYQAFQQYFFNRLVATSSLHEFCA